MINKKKIVVYSDWLLNFEDLTNEELGKLMRHFFEYVNDLNPILEDRILKIAWKPIESTLKRDLKKWDETIKKRSVAGKISAEKRKQNQQVLTSVESVKNNSTKSTVSESVNVSVSVNVIDTKKEVLFKKWVKYRKEIKKPIKKASLSSLIDYFNKHNKNDLSAAVDLSIVNGWQGLFLDKVKNKTRIPDDDNDFN